jgi:hypothetical protein
LGHTQEEFLPQLGIAVDVLQGPQERDDLMATLGVQLYLIDWRAIQPPLATRGDSHPCFSSKILWRM